MNRLDTKITFGDPFGEFLPQTFDFCTELTIDSSYNNLTDTAEVVIPKKLRYLREDGKPVDSITRGDNPLFKIGDKASISIGYDSKINEAFRGFISGIRQKFPLRFKLEDELYKLKRFPVTVSLNNPTLDELLGEVMPIGVLYEVTASQKLGKFRITNSTAAEVLNELRKKHGIYAFFRESIMYIGLAVNPSLQKVHRFEFQTPQLITGDSLTYVDATERKVKVICKSIADDNATLEASAGDSDGEIRTLYFNNYTLEDLQSTADRLAEEYRYSGYDGYFTIFATPLVNHGDIVELINRQIPEQSGGYIVIRVVTRCGWSIGGRQDVYIKQKVYDLIDDGSGKFIQKKISE
tara:strand:+ start:286 stop:1338 length:1053 start_codon:yes stop_codon:yes gene_type:complete